MSSDFKSWFTRVRELHAAKGGGGLADQEDWHEYFANGLTPEQALEDFMQRHREM